MLIHDLFESAKSHKTVVIIPGGFHPFHAGHKSLYDYAKSKYPTADIYFVASDSTKTRPFTYEQKVELAGLMGVNRSQFVKVINPFRPVEVLKNYDPNSTVVVFIRSEKDRDTTPDIDNDGFLKPIVNNPDSFKRISYVDYAPVVEFDVDGRNLDSASEIRSAYSMASDDNEKIEILKSVYPSLASDTSKLKKVFDMFNDALKNTIAENSKNTKDTSNKIDPDADHASKEMDLEDPRSREAYKIARTRYPMAKSREEALFLYSLDRTSKDIDKVEQTNVKQDNDIDRIDRVNDRQERIINRIANLEKELADQVYDLQSKITALDKNKREKVGENAIRSAIKSIRRTKLRKSSIPNKDNDS